MADSLTPEQTNATGFTAMAGESEADFIRRVVSAAPLLTREQADRLMPFLRERPPDGPPARQTA